MEQGKETSHNVFVCVDLKLPFPSFVKKQIKFFFTLFREVYSVMIFVACLGKVIPYIITKLYV